MPNDTETAAALEAEIKAKKEEIAALRAQMPAPLAGFNDAQRLILKGAGIDDPTDLVWRMKAGLTFERALEAAMTQKREDEARPKAS